MNWTKQEIEGSKRIAELGERKEIKYGDWYIQNWKLLKEVPMVIFNEKKMNLKARKLNRAIPFWTWQDCREWLKARGWKICGHSDNYDIDMPLCVRVSIIQEIKGEIIRKDADTDTEAIQKCMIKILEEKKK